MIRDWLRRRQIARAIVVSDANMILHLAAQLGQRGGNQALTSAIRELMDERSDIHHWERVQAEIGKRQPKPYMAAMRTVLDSVLRKSQRHASGSAAPAIGIGRTFAVPPRIVGSN